MNKIKKKGFTLIELIAVLVIMAIIALIVTPLVMNIIRKARVSADKRSVDAYGRSIELAIAGYLLDTGKFPTEVSQLTIEYSGNKVECETTQINADSSVYLAECTVAGRSVENYTYGKEEVITYDSYKVGDEVTYNGVDYYVIKDSSASEESVTLLKAEPLTVAEVNQYGTGHVNRYTSNSVGTAYDVNGYGGMAYYTSETCGYVNDSEIDTGCTIDYEQSEVKYVVDAWKVAQAPIATEARLIKYDELMENLGYDEIQECTGDCWSVIKKTEETPLWLYNSMAFWTMNGYDDSTVSVWVVVSDYVREASIYQFRGAFPFVRPVIVLPKSAL